MLLRYFYDDKLAQASYLVGCQETGEAIIIDPARDVQPYLLAADAEGLRISAVTETHIHADFVSGTRELVSRTGATAYLSDEGGPDWQYRFADTLPEAVLLKDGDHWMIGNVKFEARHTPGHTPEHMSYFLTDTRAASAPMGVFTGDFVFVGDVGRPDLLETAAGEVGAKEPAARQLFHSLQQFRSEPDYLQLWPGHGAGSACGKALGAVPSTTLGYEKMFNAALQVGEEAEFVSEILAGQPDPPRYFAQMKLINREGPPVLGEFPELPNLPVQDLVEKAADRNSIVVDTRSYYSFAAGHVPGTIGLPWGRDFTNYAGRALPYNRPIYLITSAAQLDEVVRALTSIGLDNLAGYFPLSAVEAWEDASEQPLRAIRQLKPQAVEKQIRSSEYNVVDVRGSDEFEEGHIVGAVNIPLDYLAERVAEVPADKPLIMACGSGGRSLVGVSLLLRAGFDAEAINLRTGTGGWIAAGLPTE